MWFSLYIFLWFLNYKKHRWGGSTTLHRIWLFPTMAATEFQIAWIHPPEGNTTSYGWFETLLVSPSDKLHPRTSNQWTMQPINGFIERQAVQEWLARCERPVIQRRQLTSVLGTHPHGSRIWKSTSMNKKTQQWTWSCWVKPRFRDAVFFLSCEKPLHLWKGNPIDPVTFLVPLPGVKHKCERKPSMSLEVFAHKNLQFSPWKNHGKTMEKPMRFDDVPTFHDPKSGDFCSATSATTRKLWGPMSWSSWWASILRRDGRDGSNPSHGWITSYRHCDMIDMFFKVSMPRCEPWCWNIYLHRNPKNHPVM